MNVEGVDDDIQPDPAVRLAKARGMISQSEMTMRELNAMGVARPVRKSTSSQVSAMEWLLGVGLGGMLGVGATYAKMQRDNIRKRSEDRKQNDDLMTQLTTKIKNKQREIQTLRNKANGTTEEAVAARLQLKQKRTEVTGLRSQIEKLRASGATQQSKLEQKRTEVTDLQAQVASLQGQRTKLNALNATVQQLRKENADLKKSKPPPSSRDEVKSLRKEIIKFKAAKKALEDEIKSARKEVDGWKGKYEAVEVKLGNVDPVKARVAFHAVSNMFQNYDKNIDLLQPLRNLQASLNVQNIENNVGIYVTHIDRQLNQLQTQNASQAETIQQLNAQMSVRNLQVQFRQQNEAKTNQLLNKQNQAQLLKLKELKEAVKSEAKKNETLSQQNRMQEEQLSKESRLVSEVTQALQKIHKIHFTSTNEEDLKSLIQNLNDNIVAKLKENKDLEANLKQTKDVLLQVSNDNQQKAKNANQLAQELVNKLKAGEERLAKIPNLGEGEIVFNDKKGHEIKINDPVQYVKRLVKDHVTCINTRSRMLDEIKKVNKFLIGKVKDLLKENVSEEANVVRLDLAKKLVEHHEKTKETLANIPNLGEGEIVFNDKKGHEIKINDPVQYVKRLVKDHVTCINTRSRMLDEIKKVNKFLIGKVKDLLKENVSEEANVVGLDLAKKLVEHYNRSQKETKGKLQEKEKQLAEANTFLLGELAKDGNTGNDAKVPSKPLNLVDLAEKLVEHHKQRLQLTTNELQERKKKLQKIKQAILNKKNKKADIDKLDVERLVGMFIAKYEKICAKNNEHESMLENAIERLRGKISSVRARRQKLLETKKEFNELAEKAIQGEHEKHKGNATYTQNIKEIKAIQDRLKANTNNLQQEIRKLNAKEAKEAKEAKIEKPTYHVLKRTLPAKLKEEMETTNDFRSASDMFTKQIRSSIRSFDEKTNTQVSKTLKPYFNANLPNSALTGKKRPTQLPLSNRSKNRRVVPTSSSTDEKS